MNLFDTKIVFEKSVITQRSINRRNKEGGLPTLSHKKWRKKEALTCLLWRTHLDILAEPQAGPLILGAEFAIFPYAIQRGEEKGEENYASYTIRLVPLQGKIATVRASRGEVCGITNFSVHTDHVNVEVEDDSHRLLIYYSPPATPLGSLPPGSRYQKLIVKT